jgi:hypothetical protein
MIVNNCVNNPGLGLDNVVIEMNKLTLRAVRKRGLNSNLRLIMQTHSFWWHTPRGNVRINPSARGGSFWEIWLGEKLICDSFTSPEQAALYASRRDFPSQFAIDLFRGIYVPSDITYWRTSPPEALGLQNTQQPTPDDVPASDCKDRWRKSGPTRLQQ